MFYRNMNFSMPGAAHLMCLCVCVQDTKNNLLSNILSVLHFAEKYVRTRPSDHKQEHQHILTMTICDHHRNQVVTSKARLIVLKMFIILRCCSVLVSMYFYRLEQNGQNISERSFQMWCCFFFCISGSNNIIQFQGKNI